MAFHSSSTKPPLSVWRKAISGMRSCAAGMLNLKFSGTPWPVNACAPAMEAPAGRARLSTLLGHTGRPTAAWAPRWVARRDSKNLPSSARVAVSRLTILGCPGRTVSEQPQYITSFPLGGS